MLIVSATFEPLATMAPAAGLCLITSPFGVELLDCSVTESVRPATPRMSLFALRIAIPFWRTDAGSCGDASCTAFWTSTSARSWSRDTSK